MSADPLREQEGIQFFSPAVLVLHDARRFLRRGQAVEATEELFALGVAACSEVGRVAQPSPNASLLASRLRRDEHIAD